ncbi:Hypothetical predicted protein [Pelobates cultripes]|uniref:Uncharacterized protein n=1 Tax=Pelobates cultripes TaxID=61616 RepID=A0AAD1WAC5_PELCU|nr:Hypothetical predicted protein [Pelobates cultripes]
MWPKMKKYWADKPPTTADIGDLLWRPQSSTRPVMAPLSDGPSCSFSEMSLPDLRELESLTRRKQAAKLSDRKSGAPVTEATIKTLLDELRRNIATDISAFREEISGVSALLHDMEQELSTLKSEQAQKQHRMAAMEEQRWWKNVKVSNLPDTVPTAEIPHLIQRLLTQLISAKQMTLDSCYRLTAPLASTTGVHRDVIICFHNGPDNQAFMTTIRNKLPYTFEDDQLTFFPDLSRATLDWRRSLRPLTSELTKHKVPYRWGAPRSLLIPHESRTLKVLEDTEIPSTLLKIRLSDTSEGSLKPALATQLSAWDPLRVRPFVPSALRGSPATTAVP